MYFRFCGAKVVIFCQSIAICGRKKHIILFTNREKITFITFRKKNDNFSLRLNIAIRIISIAIVLIALKTMNREHVSHCHNRLKST